MRHASIKAHGALFILPGGRVMDSKSGKFHCPKCGANMIPMNGGKGWKCSKAGTWNSRARKWSGCDGVIWNKQNFTPKPKTERASEWVKIEKPSAEQTALGEVLAIAPESREINSRLVIADAGPGTAKSTTVAWSAQAIAKRVGNLQQWFLVAFNVNARNSLE